MPDIHRIRRPGPLRSRAARVAGLSLLAVVAVAGTSLSPAAGAMSRPEHSAAAMPGELHGASCISASDCVAVGDHFSREGGIGEALIERWNGATWSVVPSPSPAHFPHSGAELDGVTCVSANDCLAVGWYLYSHSQNGELPFSLRWNGSKWSQVNAPRPTGAFSTSLSAVSCAGATDCWASGVSDTNTLTEHWNGSKWLTEKPVRPGGVTRSAFEAVSCPGPACVAVGNDVTAGSPVVSLAEGWNGTKWTVQPTPNPGGATFTFLQGVACTSGSNCWAAGEWGSPAGPRTLIEHWNGRAWSITA